MTLITRPYTDNDLPLVQRSLAEWIQEQGHDTGYCHVGDIPHRIYNGIRGRVAFDRAVSVTVSDDDQLLAFSLCQPFYNSFDVFINPRHRGGRVERDLLHQACQITRQLMDDHDREDKSVCSDVQENDTVRAEILLDLGFEAGRNWINDTERTLSDPIAEVKAPDGFVIRPSTSEDYAQLAAVHSGAFNSSWTPEIYRDEVMTKPGYEAEREMVVVAPDGRFAAFCIYWIDTLNKVGLFEPVGTHSDFQRKGLARALMNHTMRIMRDLGMEWAHVGHETDNPASTNLYASLGFKTKKRTFEYTKNRDA